MPDVIAPGAPEDATATGGRKVRGASVKALKKMLKKAGLKTTGKKAALTRRAKKAHLKIRGGENGTVVKGSEEKVMAGGGVALQPQPLSGGRRKSRRSRGFKLF